ncbi:MAG: DEAD/DEAH box helicase family protein [Firmicutes bacterium]|nr:DEAD/DEAH box helicase family protein [Bacillota bacterium]
MSFRTILSKHRELSFSEKDKGTRFERLMRGYLLTTPLYENIIETVWLWNDFPSKREFGRADVGIDLVARTKDGEYWAIQCKCFQEDAQIDKQEVDSFLATSSRSFLDDDGQKRIFSHRLWISTTNKWSQNAEESLHNQNPPVSRINLSDLESASVDWQKLDEGIFGYKARVSKKSVKRHQEEAIKKVHDYFLTADRGKLIMACGTGKTYTALKIAEAETRERERERINSCFSAIYCSYGADIDRMVQ